MDKIFNECPNCNKKIKDGAFSSTELISNARTQLINEYTDNKSEAFCTNCFGKPLNQAILNWQNQYKEISESLKNIISNIPVITLQQPLNWKYSVVGMVSGQSVTGTGIISEISSSFTDLFGLQSSKFGNKIKDGEEICKAQIRLYAAEIGANAIIGTDIDYSEVGGGKGMLMVCMSGTAIKLENLDILDSKAAEKLSEIENLAKTLKNLSRFKILINNLTT